MKLAVITDSSAYIDASYLQNEDLYILDIPVTIEGATYIEGKNLTATEFYEKMSQSQGLPMTSQPSLAELDLLLTELKQNGYTHVIGLFLSSGISGFWSNAQFLIEEHADLKIAIPDSLITSAPLGMMVANTLDRAAAGVDFETILEKLDQQIKKTTAFIMVDDLDHLVKGGRLSNGAALIGNLLKIKPILYFNAGTIEVYEKVRTEKKAVKRLLEILQEVTADGTYQIAIIHANVPEKAAEFKSMLQASGLTGDLPIVPFGSVIGTHLGEGAIAFGITPI